MSYKIFLRAIAGRKKIKGIDRKKIELPAIEEDKSQKIIAKPLEYKELIIALERITRFKYPVHSKDRVYRDILTKHTVNPKIGLKNYYNYSLNIKDRLVKSIWDASIELLNKNLEHSYLINLYLAYENTKSFNAKQMVNDLIIEMSGLARPSEYENPESILDLFEDNGFNMSLYYELKDEFGPYPAIYIAYYMNYPLNLDGLLELINHDESSMSVKRLVELNKEFKQNFQHLSIIQFLNKAYKKAEECRIQEGSWYPVKAVVLTEGITEKMLLPVFANKMKIDFSKYGVQIIASGGKNQVSKLYEDYSVNLVLPILIILDSDAKEIADKIRIHLRNEDRIFIIPEGEFEDILPVGLICRALNRHFKLTGTVIPDEICKTGPMTQSLLEIWKKKGYGNFNKAEFAAIISENIDVEADISSTIKHILNLIVELL